MDMEPIFLIKGVSNRSGIRYATVRQGENVIVWTDGNGNYYGSGSVADLVN